MQEDYNRFIETIDSPNTAKVVKSLKKIGEYDYSNCTPAMMEHIILSLEPNSPKSITTIVYILSLYAKFLGNDNMYHMVKDINRNALWLIAKPGARKKFISYSQFKETFKDIELYEEYNSLYISALFRCIYEGIYSDDMSVIKNLRSSDIDGELVTLRDDNGKTYNLSISESLAKDLKKLGTINTWSRNNRYGECKIKTTGLYKDSCFKVENRKGSAEYAYRYSYYRILRNISKNYIGYSVLPLHLFISGIMHDISVNLQKNGIDMEDAFLAGNRNREVGKVIASELARKNYNIEVRNFREIVSGHLDIFISDCERD